MERNRIVAQIVITAFPLVGKLDFILAIALLPDRLDINDMPSTEPGCDGSPNGGCDVWTNTIMGNLPRVELPAIFAPARSEKLFLQPLPVGRHCNRLFHENKILISA